MELGSPARRDPGIADLLDPNRLEPLAGKSLDLGTAERPWEAVSWTGLVARGRDHEQRTSRRHGAGDVRGRLRVKLNRQRLHREARQNEVECGVPLGGQVELGTRSPDFGLLGPMSTWSACSRISRAICS